MKSRIDSIYIAKCLGIFLVVLIHVFDTWEPIWSDTNSVNIMIHSFVMPFFMFLSGFVLANKDFNDLWLKKKITKILPLIIISVIGFWLFETLLPGLTLYKQYFTLRPNISLGQFIWDGLITGFGNTVSWYLFVMLQCYIALWVIQKAKNIIKIGNINLYIIIAIIVINIIPYYNMGFANVKWYGLFLLLGCVIGTYKEKLNKFSIVSYFAIPIFIAIGYFTNWMSNWQDLEYGSRGFTIISRDLTDGRVVLLLVMLGFIITGGLSVIGLARIINKIKFIRKYVISIGTMTLGVYLLHSVFTGINSNYFITYPSVLVISIGLTIVIRYIISRYKVGEVIRKFVNKKKAIEAR